MRDFQFRKMRAIAIVAAAILCLAASEKLVAASPAAGSNINYVASGVFATPAISGSDQIGLAGQPFTLIVVAKSGAAPTSHGTDWATFGNLTVLGRISTNLGPLGIKSKLGNLLLSTANPAYDLVALSCPFEIIAFPIQVVVNLHAPSGTLSKPAIGPFASVKLAAPDTVTYSEINSTPPLSTKLGIASGTLVAQASTTADDAVAPASVQLHAGGVNAITVHANGTRSVRAIGTGPVDLGASSDIVALQFYASGIGDASDVRVRIAGRDVPVMYAGPAVFPGLDEINVKVPHNLAGSGNVEVELTVDGRTAKPVSIQIQ